MTADVSMPFITGPAAASDASIRLSSPKGDLVSVVPLSKVQEILWLDYVRRPCATHYSLTLQVDLSDAKASLEDILTHIHNLGVQHDMLRTTFHLDDEAQDMSQSYMAVHDPVTSFQKVDIVSNEAALAAALRQPFDLSTEFPVKWVIHQECAFVQGRLRSSYKVYAVGHHVAVDGSSMSFLSHQMLQIGSEDATSTVIPTYGEFVQRSTAYLKGDNAKLAEQFWLSQVSNTVTHEWTHAPVASPSTKDYRQIDSWAFFSNDELKQWSKLYSTSWFRIATAAIGAVLTGHSEASPHSDHTLQVAFGAREPRFAQCVSHMANTMPIRQPLSELLQKPSSTFGDLVKRVGKSISQSKKHEMFSFMSVIEAAKSKAAEGESAFTPSKVAVTFSPKLADKRCTLYPVQGVWDLFFCFLEHDDGVSLGVIVDPKIFDAAAISALKASFMDTIRLSQQTSSFTLASLPYLKDRGIGAILDGPKITDIDTVNNARVTDWITRRAFAQPHALALFSGEEKTSMTYAALEKDSNSRAFYLQQNGTKRGDVIVLHMDRSFSLVVWILAVLKTGACYVVLDKALPLARKQAILRVSACQTFVTDVENAAFFAECSTEPHVINTWTLTNFAHGTPESVESEPEDLAYIIFTSGSTGTPKAIMVEHQNLSCYVSSTRNVVSVGPGSRVLQFASFAFDASILEWAVTLSYGATLCFVKTPSVLVDDYLADMINLNQINFFHTTPSVLSTIPVARSTNSLKLLSVGGEAASAGLLDKWSKRLKLIHAYGPTETTVICANEVINPALETLPLPSNIGLANTNMSILICPENSEQVLENGETGEICIAGPQVSRGYRGQPELTEQKFRTVEVNGQKIRMYRSGDQGFLAKEDGKLHILGRLNHREVKVRGYRIDLAAVEKSILDHCSEVVMASVQVIDESLACLLVPESVKVASVRERISKDLPAYSVPTRFLPVKTLPLNINGKVDHKKVLEEFAALGGGASTIKQELPLPSAAAEVDVKETALADAEDEKAEKLSYIQATITNLWQEVLGSANAPGLDTTFYDAGGHSILLSVLHKKVMQEFPAANVSLLDMFYNPTIRRQAAHLVGSLPDLPLPSSRASSIAHVFGGTSTPAGSVSSRSSISESNPTENKFAIVGVAGRFPGANSVDEMWNLLMAQRDGVTTSDGSGAELAHLQDGEIFIPRYGSIEGFDEFKGSEWAMSEDEAKALDPQKRMFLVVAREALKDASIKVQEPEGTRVGTFVGIAHNTFQAEVPETGTFESRYRVVLDPNASTLTAFKLNLTGPSLDVNTACASSVVAVHLGISALQSGDCDTALIGGVSVAYPQIGGYATSDGKIFSASGDCRPLDVRSDGSVPADGVAAVVLKPLSAAREANDRIYAVIEGHAIGTDGAIDKIGFTVPSSSGQAKVVKQAILNSGVKPSQIKYVEMHGSGTSIGDALEFQGLKRAFVSADAAYQERDNHSYNPLSRVTKLAASNNISMASTPTAQATELDYEVHVGSNKGNFGNAEAASGMISLIKAALAVQKGVVPPIRQLGELNKLLGAGKSIIPLREHMKLNTNDRVGVTALGYGGVNAHCIIASADAE